MIALIVAMLVAQATPAASPVAQPSLSPEWKSLAVTDALEYARYQRHEQDGSDSIIFASTKVCDCQADATMQMLQNVFASTPGAVIKRDTTTACGEPADRLLVTGLANPSTAHRNIETVMFRHGPAFYSFVYTFSYAAPMPDAEKAMMSLCPVK
jgi:hypothetical protein